MTDYIEILPPIGDGTWWIVQCHRCRTLVGAACGSRHEAEQRAAGHDCETAGNQRLRDATRAVMGA